LRSRFAMAPISSGGGINTLVTFDATPWLPDR